MAKSVAYTIPLNIGLGSRLPNGNPIAAPRKTAGASIKAVTVLQRMSVPNVKYNNTI